MNISSKRWWLGGTAHDEGKPRQPAQFLAADRCSLPDGEVLQDGGRGVEGRRGGRAGPRHQVYGDTRKDGGTDPAPKNQNTCMAECNKPLDSEQVAFQFIRTTFRDLAGVKRSAADAEGIDVLIERPITTPSKPRPKPGKQARLAPPLKACQRAR